MNLYLYLYLHVNVIYMFFFIFIWWPKFLWERKFGQQTKRKNTCNNEMKMEVSTLEFPVQRRIF